MRHWVLVALLATALAAAVWFMASGSWSSRDRTRLDREATAAIVSRSPDHGAISKSSNSNVVSRDEPTVGSHPQGAAGVAPVSLPPATPFLFGSADTPPAMEPATVLSNMRIAIRQYGSRFGGNPVGTNEEITRALNGGNPKQVNFISEESGLRINGRGELVDYWGTPFFFHQLSSTEMEIRSAGPDKIMWTADDLVTK
jgi:hypothetical protein